MSHFYEKIKKQFINSLFGIRIMEDGEIFDGDKVWFISDMHFGHRNIIKWCRYDCFKNLKQMHERMISN
jgi:hypothetical protein